jgi:hypothetical protein
VRRRQVGGPRSLSPSQGNGLQPSPCGQQRHAGHGQPGCGQEQPAAAGIACAGRTHGMTRTLMARAWG